MNPQTLKTKILTNDISGLDLDTVFKMDFSIPKEWKPDMFKHSSLQAQIKYFDRYLSVEDRVKCLHYIENNQPEIIHHFLILSYEYFPIEIYERYYDSHYKNMESHIAHFILKKLISEGFRDISLLNKCQYLGLQMLNESFYQKNSDWFKTKMLAYIKKDKDIAFKVNSLTNLCIYDTFFQPFLEEIIPDYIEYQYKKKKEYNSHWYDINDVVIEHILKTSHTDIKLAWIHEKLKLDTNSSIKDILLKTTHWRRLVPEYELLFETAEETLLNNAMNDMSLRDSTRLFYHTLKEHLPNPLMQEYLDKKNVLRNVAGNSNHREFDKNTFFLDKLFKKDINYDECELIL